MFIRVLFTVIWEIIENYFDIRHYIDDIKDGENANKTKKKTPTEFGKDVSGRRFEERTSIWVYHIYIYFIVFGTTLNDNKMYKKYWNLKPIMDINIKLSFDIILPKCWFCGIFEEHNINTSYKLCATCTWQVYDAYICHIPYFDITSICPWRLDTTNPYLETNRS